MHGWYDDYPAFVDSGNPWFVRGRGYYVGAASAGVFAFNGNGGKPIPVLAFRSVLAPGA